MERQIKVDEKLSNYLQLLDYNVTSRKTLAFEAASRFGAKSEIARLYTEEFMIYDVKFNMAKESLSNSLFNNELKSYASWSLDYATSIVTITIDDKCPNTVKLEDPDNNKLVNNIIDEDVNRELTRIYTQNFDDEVGIVNTTKCATCK